jgi:hypothetical protein
MRGEVDAEGKKREEEEKGAWAKGRSLQFVCFDFFFGLTVHVSF